jgi:hypothetical protein
VWRELPAETRGWSEEDWEEFFKRQDERHLAEMQSLSADGATHLGDSAGCEGPDGSRSEPQETDLSEGECECDVDESLDRIPAWRSAVAFCNRVVERVSPICEDRGGTGLDHIAQTLVAECYLVPEYLLAGHELGYDENTLCGNIALCLRSRSSLERCMRWIERVSQARPDCAGLLVQGAVARGFIERRIAELRAEVWWR